MHKISFQLNGVYTLTSINGGLGQKWHQNEIKDTGLKNAPVQLN